MTTERLPSFGPRAATVPTARGRRLLERALAHPSLAAVAGLVVVVLFFGPVAPGLLSSAGLAGVLDSAAPLGIGGVAVALLLISGQFDLSIGMIAAGSALVTGLLVEHAGWDIWPGLLVSLAAALLVGVVNGWLVVATGLPSFLVTLATFLVLQGTALAGTGSLTESVRLDGLDAAEGWSSAEAVFGSAIGLGDGRFGISLLWWLGLTAWAGWVLWRTRFGNAVFAVGGARQAARELGVADRRTTMVLYGCTAAAGWLIGTLDVVRLGGVQATTGLGTAVELVVVAVIGGCLLTGGYGSVVGAAVGALVYATAGQGVVLAGWEPRWFEVFLGVLLLVALLANGIVRGRLRRVPLS
ncbi:ABC transporter permease [Geodermatophilus ruber]|uniref:Xylose transport system permease protein XylH n=1 Tax=Geodermatophilus ruber TaxID=504800 RepID=A0A1I3Z5S8_9ACTN|nr:ABC transporter permease [Geodermatophilus ruber]SFK39021.1 monosaccharide ABC transporter membrane protein, CUT2 family [Geodermatophilus ruber]